MLTKRKYQYLALSFFVIVLLSLTLASLKLTNGHLIYSLDDPYIHLAVAENILRGGYGINLSEYSSPSSSIIYTFLLAGTTYLGLDEWGPFCIAVFSMGLAIWFASGFFWKYGVKTQKKAYRWLFFVTAPLIVLVLNSFGLIFTGLEHCLSVLASVLVIVGLAKMINRGTVSVLLIIGIVLLVSTRFETIPFALAAIFVLFWQKHYTAGMIATALVLAILVGYASFMSRLGLPFLPSSVLAKSGLSSAATDHNLVQMLNSILNNFANNFKDRWIILVLVGAIFLITSVLATYDARKTLSPKFKTGIYVIGGLSAFVLVTQSAGGSVGAFAGRYETYAIVVMVLGLVYVYSRGLAQIKSFLVQAFMIPALLMVFDVYSVKILFKSAAASQNIYDQQYQMHRFVTEYFPYSLAVNDLGWVSYKNDNYVLDLWGLGSEKARKIRYNPRVTAEDIKQLTASENVVFAMVYDSWFPRLIPESWCPIAVLTTPIVTVGSGKVNFYLIDKSKEDEMRKALSEFIKTLPTNDSMTIANGCSPS